ncbi:MAG: porin family protein [Saprospiraceae bacterium]|jgi:hypothetical protein|nr:porin family protein [Saprospiraceae bacterium]
MRILFPLVLLLFSYHLSNAQAWLELGPKVSYGFTGYYNSSIAADDRVEYQLQATMAYGGTVGVNFDDFGGFNLEALLTQNEQTVNSLDILNTRIDNSLNWETLDLLLMYRFYSDKGGYFELGPKMSIIQTVEQTIGNNQVIDAEESYSENYFSGALGFGGFIAGSKAFTLKLGIRVEYAFTDLVSDNGKDLGFPTPITSFINDSNTSPYRASVGLELSFGIGGMAKSVCGRRVFLFGSRYR